MGSFKKISFYTCNFRDILYLKAFDEEVLSIKDEKVTVSGNTNLAPGESSSNMTITYHVKNGEIPYFTTAEASIHKIHWVVRRVVKK